MAYIPFESRVFPFIIYYFILSVFGLLITLKILHNYLKKKHPAALYLTLTFAVLTLGIIVLAIGLSEGAITGYYKEIYRFSLPFAYSMVILADIFLFKFTNQLTKKGRNAFIPILLIGTSIIIVLFLPFNYWSTPQEEIGQPYIRIYTMISVVLYSFTIYIIIIILCRITKKYSDSKIHKVRLSLLSYSMLSLTFFFLMLLVDTYFIVFYGAPGYSIYVYIGWLFASFFLILSYFSLFMPKRFLERIEKKSESE